MSTEPNKLELMLEIAAMRSRLDALELQAFALPSEDEGEEAKFMQAMETLTGPSKSGSPQEE